jgi:UDPglucose--hexose-1-phosphate uridylyltransferase
MDQNLQGLALAIRSLPMPELRKDPIVGRWVIIATDRAKRPVASKIEPVSSGGTFCPFCEGSEGDTPSHRLHRARP